MEAGTQNPPEADLVGGRQCLDRDNYAPAHLVRLANAVSRGASRIYLKLFGVGVVEWRILSVLANAPGSTAQDISDRIDLDKASASRSVKLLEASGYITLRRHESDQRRSCLFLTPTGQDLHDAIFMLAIRREERLLQGFSAPERAMIIWLLQRMSANLGKLDELDEEIILKHQSGVVEYETEEPE